MSEIFEPIKTFLGYFFQAILLIVVAIIYLPAFLLTTYLNKPFDDLLKNFNF